jgi:hypothetical protein
VNVPKRTTERFRILDAGLVLRGPAEVVDPIAFAYRRFVAQDAGPQAIRIELEGAGAASIRVDGRDIPRVPGLDSGLQLYQCVLDALMDRFGSHALLHAAALRIRSGGALLLAAPSGHGKSSLALELAYRGLGFLGDDYAPLDLERREILPYPRAVGIDPEGSAPIPGPFRRQVGGAGVVRLFGKCLLDVGSVLGEPAVVSDPQPLRGVVLLSAHGSTRPETPTRILIAAREEDGAALQSFLAETAGIEILDRADRRRLSMWNLRLDREAAPTEALSRVLESEQVLFSEKVWDERPDFQGPPALTPVRRREAAEFLGRELLNRRRAGRLLARHGGSLTALFLSLAGALREASCWSLRVGEFAETAALIDSLAD